MNRSRAFVLCLSVLLCGAAGGIAGPSDPELPVWLVSNGFHSSLAFRARDFPHAEMITTDPRPDIVVIGWGASRFYQGHVDPLTIFRAIFGLDSTTLHVVPVRGALARRFAHSDVIRFDIPAENARALIREFDATFALDPAGKPIPIGPGYFPDSRFYLARGHFYFPKMCNLWVAQKLRGAGVSVGLFTSIVAKDLVHHAAQLGRREQYRRAPTDSF